MFKKFKANMMTVTHGYKILGRHKNYRIGPKVSSGLGSSPSPPGSQCPGALVPGLRLLRGTCLFTCLPDPTVAARGQGLLCLLSA